MAQWKFRFDKDYFSASNPSGCAASGGLTASFSRNRATVDPLGVAVSAGNARFDRPMIVAPVLPDDEVTIRVNNQDQDLAPESRILASGVAADGTTPVSVYLDEDHKKLFVITGNDNEGVKTDLPDTTLVDTTKGFPGVNYSAYAMDVPSDSAGARIVPQAAVVVHGLIVLAGAYLLPVDSEYQVVGWCFVMSLNGGATWLNVWNDSEKDSPEVDHWRGREWCLHASTAHNMVDRPTECWIASTDYRVQRNDNTPPPHGGRITLFRFVREDEDSSEWDWIANSTTGDPFTYFIEPGTDVSVTGCHAHSAHLVEYGASGLQMLVSMGDAQYHSRFVRFSISDYSSSDDAYTLPENWTIDWEPSANPGGYHGYPETTVDNSEVLGCRSQQPVGVAIGSRGATTKPFGTTTATRSTLIWGGDEQSEVLTRMVLPEPNESPNQLWIEHLYGFTTGFGSSYTGSLKRLRGIVFSLAQARPENANDAGESPLVAVLSNADDNTESEPRNSMTRILYCPDPVSNPALWMQIATRWGSSSGTAVLHGAKVYFCAYGDDTANKNGLRSIDVSELDTTVFKPIIVGPGGKNLAISTCYVAVGDQAKLPNGNPDVVALSKVNGFWVDGLPSATIRKLPHPPSMTSKVYRVRTRRTATGGTNKFICRIHLSGNSSTTWNDLASNAGWDSSVDQVRRVRCWVLDGSYNVLTGGNLQSRPNKTAQMSMRMIDGGDNNPPSFQGAPLLFSCSNRWCPLTIVGFRAIDPLAEPQEKGIGVELLCSSDTGFDAFPPDDNYLYLAIDGAFDGNGSMPYPTALTSASGTPDDCPNELLSLTFGTSTFGYPLSLGHDWTLRLAGQVPIGTWDQYADRKDPDDDQSDLRYWPLCTLRWDEDNWIEVSANCVSTAFRIRVWVNGQQLVEQDFGAGDQLWVPESVLQLAVSWDTTAQSLQFGASLAGGFVATFGLDEIDWPGGLPDACELQFYGADGEVAEFRWIGGDVRDVVTGIGDMASAFDSILFMRGPTP